MERRHPAGKDRRRLAGERDIVPAGETPAILAGETPALHAGPFLLGRCTQVRSPSGASSGLRRRYFRSNVRRWLRSMRAIPRGLGDVVLRARHQLAHPALLPPVGGPLLRDAERHPRIEAPHARLRAPGRRDGSPVAARERGQDGIVEEDGALHRRAQLAHVARPRLAPEEVERGRPGWPPIGRRALRRSGARAGRCRPCARAAAARGGGRR